MSSRAQIVMDLLNDLSLVEFRKVINKSWPVGMEIEKLTDEQFYKLINSIKIEVRHVTKDNNIYPGNGIDH